MSPETSIVILVVEDEPPLRELAARILTRAGYTVLEASNGIEGLAVLTAGTHVDLLVSDIDMPELAGDEMARRMRAMHPDLKVLYVTGKIDQLMYNRPVLWEGEAFLEKPYSPAGLLEAVLLLLRGSQSV